MRKNEGSQQLNVVNGKLSHSEGEAQKFRTDAVLLCADFLLSPSGKTAVTLNGESITTVATAEATNTRAQAAERILLGSLGLLNRVVERTLGESRKAYSAGMLSTRVQV